MGHRALCSIIEWTRITPIVEETDDKRAIIAVPKLTPEYNMLTSGTLPEGKHVASTYYPKGSITVNRSKENLNKGIHSDCKPGS